MVVPYHTDRIGRSVRCSGGSNPSPATTLPVRVVSFIKIFCYTLGADGVNLSASAKAPYSCETWLYFGASGCAPSYRWKHLRTKRRDAPDSFFMD